MKAFPARLLTRLIFFPIGCLFLTAALANDSPVYTKIPWGVGFWMEGTVTNVALADERVQFQLNGRFWFAQHPWGGTNQQVIEVHCKSGISATVSQAEPFFAMSVDWRGGALRQKGELFKILKTAAERGSAVKFQLTQPKMDFGRDQNFTLTDAIVIRATDADLR